MSGQRAQPLPVPRLRRVRSDAVRGLFALGVVLVAGVLYTWYNAGWGENAFLRADVHTGLMRRIAEFGILAAGMTFVILTGGIDLSVGSVLALSSMIFTYALIRLQLPPYLALLAGVGVGTLCGVACGAVISKMGLQPFVVTLAMMVFARGAARQVSDSEKIQLPTVTLPDGEVARDRPEIFQFWGGRLWPDAPIPILDEIFVVSLVFLFIIVIGHIVLSKMWYGRHVFAIGGNEEAAKYSGIRVALNKTAAYAICGTMAGVAGVLNACQVEMGDPNSGMYRELDAIAAVVIGGTALTGGRGGMLLTLLGVLIIGYIETILSLNSVPDPWRLMSKGLIIVAAVLIQQRRRH